MKQGRKLTGEEKIKILELLVESFKGFSDWYRAELSGSYIEHTHLLEGPREGRMLPEVPSFQNHI